MAYVPVNWVAGVTPLSEANLDHLETQYQEMLNLFDAHTILMAATDNNPAALTIAASRILGPKSSGNIGALTGAEVLTIIGRIGKSNLGWASAKLLLGAGVGSDPTEVAIPTTATKELFVRATPSAFSALQETRSGWVLVSLEALNNSAYMSFKVPHDYSAIVSAEIIVVPYVTDGAANWDISSAYATIGEAYTLHTESDAGSTYNVTLNQVFNVNVAGVLSGIAADDYATVKILLADAADDMGVFGLRFRYS